MKFTAEIRAAGAALFHQQFWQWGYDIRRTEGNVLQEYGFKRYKGPANTSSRYSLAFGSRRVIDLWGFGFFSGPTHHNGIYVNRYEFLPRHANASGEIWTPGPLASGKPVEDHSPELAFLVATLRWIARYEEWVLANFGEDYRLQAASAWDKPFRWNYPPNGGRWRWRYNPDGAP